MSSETVLALQKLFPKGISSEEKVNEMIKKHPYLSLPGVPENIDKLLALGFDKKVLVKSPRVIGSSFSHIHEVFLSLTDFENDGDKSMARQLIFRNPDLLFKTMEYVEAAVKKAKTDYCSIYGITPAHIEALNVLGITVDAIKQHPLILDLPIKIIASRIKRLSYRWSIDMNTINMSPTLLTESIENIEHQLQARREKIKFLALLLNVNTEYLYKHISLYSPLLKKGNQLLHKRYLKLLKLNTTNADILADLSILAEPHDRALKRLQIKRQ